MNQEALSEVLSSRARLKIVDALSIRPRTLGELSATTGISVQGVLRHLRRLGELGLVEERKLVPRTPKARRVYASKSTAFGDYSAGDLTVVKSTEKLPSQGHQRLQDLEKVAGEILLHRRRVGERARRLGELIDGVVTEQEELEAALEGARLTAEEKLMLRVILTEETLEDGARVLSRFYGVDDRRSIDKALAKARRIGAK